MCMWLRPDRVHSILLTAHIQLEPLISDPLLTLAEDPPAPTLYTGGGKPLESKGGKPLESRGFP